MANGLWSATATWGGTLPAATDDIVITHAVTATTNLTMHSLDITTTGTLSVNPVTVQVKGNFTLHPGGTFNAGTSTMRFSGATGQTISGSPTFYVLRADNLGASTDADAVVATDPIVCLSSLVVNDGQFMMTNGQVNDIVVSGNGGVLFKPLPGAIITVTGATGAGVAFSRIGGFTHNNSKFIFAGSARQVVTSGAFYDVEVANTAAVPSTTNEVDFSGSVSNQLVVSDGQIGTANGISLRNVTIAAGATLRQAGELRISGSLVNNGTLAHGGYKTKLNGSGSQTLSGTLSFGALESDNIGAVSDATAVAAVDAVQTTGTLTVTRGLFLLPTGSQLNDISISGNSGAAIKVATGATITVTGASSSNISFQRLGGTGSFTPNNSKFIFAGSGRQVIPSGNFYDLEVANTASTPSSTNEVEFSGTVSRELSVSDGQVSISGGLPNLTVGPAGRVRYRALVSISGNFTNNGVLDDAGFATRFNGSAAQLISGTTRTFSAVTVDSFGAVDDATAITASGAMVITGALSIIRGLLILPDGSQVGNVSLSGNAGVHLKVPPASVITVTGADGSGVAFTWGGAAAILTHNNSKFVFAGSGRQVVGGPTFYDIEVANTAAAPDSTNEVELNSSVTNSLSVTDGQVSVSGSLPTLTVGPAGRVRYRALVNIGSNFTNNGVLADAGFATRFNGVGSQTISGTGLTFSLLTIDNTGAVDDATAVTATNPITTTGTATVTRGQFMPPDGSHFNNIAISGNTSARLKPVASATITVTGANGSNVAISLAGGSDSFVHNNSTFVFAGSGRQTVAGIHWNLEVANTAATPDSTNEVAFSGTLANDLTITDGQFSNSGNITPRNVTIAAAGTLRQGSLLRVTGDMTVNGGFLNGGFATHFVGSGPQLVSGSPTFAAIQVQNHAATPSDTDAVIFQDTFVCTGLLDVNRGRALLSNDVTVQRFFLNLGASCKAGTGRRFTITGADGSGNAFSPYGDFFHNNGTVVFAGSGIQKVENETTFWNLEVANTAAVPGTSAEVYENGHIDNNLTILDGQISLGFGSNFGTTTVGPNGSLRLRDERWFGSTLVVDGVTDFSGAPIVAFFSAGTQHFTASVPVAFPTVRIVNGTTLVEDGTANATATGLDLQGTNRLQRFIASVPTGPVGGGLTGVALNVTTLGTLGALTIERFETVPNAAPQHATADAAFTFDLAGATGYTLDLTLPHALATPANAQVSSYLGTGTNWDFAQNSFTTNSVTRTGLTSLASVWAVGDSALTKVDDWQLLQD